MPDPEVNLERTNEHLNLLAIGHYVVGALMMLVACFPLIHLGLGIMLLLNPPADLDGGPAVMVGLLFIGVATIIILAGWILGGLIIYTGRCLAARKKYTFSLVISCIECLFMPLGTILGVLTLVVLLRQEAKALFQPPLQS